MTLAAKPNSATDRTMPYRRSLFSILLFGVFLSGCSGLHGEEVEPTTQAAAEFTFEQYEVVTGSAQRQTVLTGFLLGSAIAELAEIAVVHIDENDDRRLRIYAFGDGAWVPILDEEYTWLVDLNKDGVHDVLVHHPSTEPHQVTMLIAR